MDDYGQSTYGDRIAHVYDEWYPGNEECEKAVELLAELAGDGPALELGIGTGRLALPLADRGIDVHGIDASEAMIEHLTEKPGGEAVSVAVGDFADVEVEAEFALIFVAFSTFFALLSQDEQIRCFKNVSDHLAPGGAFVIEAFVPDMTRWAGDQAARVTTLQASQVVIEASQHDPVEQRVTSHHVVVGEEGTRLYPAQVRYAWPSELDLMGRLAGLALIARWSDWGREPFTASSTGHVSVYKETATTQRPIQRERRTAL